MKERLLEIRKRKVESNMESLERFGVMDCDVDKDVTLGNGMFVGLNTNQKMILLFHKIVGGKKYNEELVSKTMGINCSVFKKNRLALVKEGLLVKEGKRGDHTYSIKYKVANNKNFLSYTLSDLYINVDNSTKLILIYLRGWNIAKDGEAFQCTNKIIANDLSMGTDTVSKSLEILRGLGYIETEIESQLFIKGKEFKRRMISVLN